MGHAGHLRPQLWQKSSGLSREANFTTSVNSMSSIGKQYKYIITTTNNNIFTFISISIFIYHLYNALISYYIIYYYFCKALMWIEVYAPLVVIQCMHTCIHAHSLTEKIILTTPSREHATKASNPMFIFWEHMILL